MKLLTSPKSWQQWIKEEQGRFADTQHPPPKKYPCYGYMELASWSQELLRPVYLYSHDLDDMTLELLAMAQKM